MLIVSPLRLTPPIPFLSVARRRAMFVVWTVAVEMATGAMAVNLFRPAAAACAVALLTLNVTKPPPTDTGNDAVIVIGAIDGPMVNVVWDCPATIGLGFGENVPEP